MNSFLFARGFAFLLAASTAFVCGQGPATKSSQNAEQKQEVPEWAEQFGGRSLTFAWEAATAANNKIADALAGKKLEGVAGWAETVHLAAHALDDQLKLADVEKGKRLKGALELAAKIADDVVHAAQHGEPERAADAHRRLKSALDLIRARLPKDVTEPGLGTVTSAGLPDAFAPR